MRINKESIVAVYSKASLKGGSCGPYGQAFARRFQACRGRRRRYWPFRRNRANRMFGKRSWRQASKRCFPVCCNKHQGDRSNLIPSRAICLAVAEPERSFRIEQRPSDRIARVRRPENICPPFRGSNRASRNRSRKRRSKAGRPPRQCGRVFLSTRSSGSFPNEFAPHIPPCGIKFNDILYEADATASEQTVAQFVDKCR